MVLVGFSLLDGALVLEASAATSVFLVPAPSAGDY